MYTDQSQILPLASMCVSDFVHGAVELEACADGWIRPQRFLAAQRRALASCLAWHPGLYRSMASTTAGVCLRFETDANEIRLAFAADELPEPLRELTRRLDDENKGTDASLRSDEMSQAALDLCSPSVVVDGRRLGPQRVADGSVSVCLRDSEHGSGNGVMALPGLGKRHEVTVWLPCGCGCRVRELWADATYVEAVPVRGRLLVVGDGSAQGVSAGDASLCWCARLSEFLDLELINQGVVGQVFQPSAWLDARIDGVEHVVVELGERYRFERCDATAVAADVRGCMAELRRHWPQALSWAVVPVAGEVAHIARGSCYAELGRIVGEAARRRNVQVVDGTRLIDRTDAARLVGSNLPSVRGHAQIARRLGKRMRAAEGGGAR